MTKQMVRCVKYCVLVLQKCDAMTCLFILRFELEIRQDMKSQKDVLG